MLAPPRKSSGKKFWSVFLKVVSSPFHLWKSSSLIVPFCHFCCTIFDEAHVDAQLDPVLKTFDLLSNCVDDINGADVRELENNVLENPLDESVQAQLLATTDTMGER